jgi:hypothetical protein
LLESLSLRLNLLEKQSGKGLEQEFLVQRLRLIHQQKEQLQRE